MMLKTLKTIGIMTVGILLGVINGASENIEDKENPDISDFNFPVECNCCNTEMVHTKGTNEWRCPECGNGMVVEEGNFYYEHSPKEDYNDYYEDMPECCKACGCDGFPQCMTTCPLFDD